MSSALNALASDSIRSRCSTGAKSVDSSAPTFWVGESGVRSSGCRSSIACSSRISASYSPSAMVGRSSTW
jgi:hypothetical protein